MRTYLGEKKTKNNKTENIFHLEMSGKESGEIVPVSMEFKEISQGNSCTS